MRRVIHKFIIIGLTIKLLCVSIGLLLLLASFLDLRLDLWIGLMAAGSFLLNIGLFPWMQIQSWRPKRRGSWRIWAGGFLLLGISTLLAFGVYVKIMYENHIPLLIKIIFWTIIQAIWFVDGVNDLCVMVKDDYDDSVSR